MFLKKYNKRLQSLLGENINQVRFLETMDYRTYLQVLSQCDLMIDPFPFGGCNTTLESFALGKVVITKSNRLLPGRFSLGFYQKIGINENTPDSPVCPDNNSYIERCHELLVNRDKRQAIEKIIQNNSGSLFLEQESIKEWEGVITRLIRERHPSKNINVEIEKLPSVSDKVDNVVEKIGGEDNGHANDSDENDARRESDNDNSDDSDDSDENNSIEKEDDSDNSNINDEAEFQYLKEIAVLKKSVDSLKQELEKERKLYKKN